MARPNCVACIECDGEVICDCCDFNKRDGCSCYSSFTREERIAALLDALKELGVDVPQWQPIETAPDKGIILVCGGSHYHEKRPSIVNHKTLNLYNIVWKDKDGKWCGGFDDGKGEYRIIFNPTYWMPLPQPPKEG